MAVDDISPHGRRRIIMRGGYTIALVAGALLVAALPAHAQAPRQDVVWARAAGSAPITLDGRLTEPVWAQAESVLILFKRDNGIPGSGYKYEAGVAPTDSTAATLKFLTKGNYLYLGVRLPDKSIGGATTFNRFDGLLMQIMDHTSPNRPVPPQELFYVWWDGVGEPGSNPGAIDQVPAFISGNTGGKFSDSAYAARTPTQIDNWNAVTWVQGHSNTDTTAGGGAAEDTAWTVEMRFNLGTSGYDVTRAEGDTIEWSIQIYDCDWFWPQDGARFASNRVWWENPWGNTSWYNEVKIHANPSVTVTSGPVPVPGPDLRIYQAANDPDPVIDGSLSESIWSRAGHFDIRYGDYGLVDSYPGVGRWRSGFYQPSVQGGQAAVVDPGDCTVKYFWKGTKLYLGFDVRDQFVQYYPLDDRWDGFYVILVERAVRDAEDRNLKARKLGFYVNQAGGANTAYQLPTLIAQGKAACAIQLKPGTTVDTTGIDIDTGYTAELMVDLMCDAPACTTGLGYDANLLDHWLFMGIDMFDGDSFDPFTDSYGTRAWWFCERDGENGPAWCYLDPQVVAGVGDESSPAVSRFALLGNAPNPFGTHTSIRYAMPNAGRVVLEVFDVQGRHVTTRTIGLQEAGVHNYVFDGRGLASGLYVYKLRVADPQSDVTLASLSGRLMLTR
jgi:hypothetical protein